MSRGEMPHDIQYKEKSKNPKVLQKQKAELNWVNRLLRIAQKKGWYGKMIIEIKNGMIDIVCREETLKPPKDNI